MTTTKQTASTTFTAMRDATREDYQLIGRHSLEFVQGLPQRILSHLQILAGETDSEIMSGGVTAPSSVRNTTRTASIPITTLFLW